MKQQDQIIPSEPSSPHQVAPIMDGSNDEREYENYSEDEHDEEMLTMAQNMGLSIKEMFELFEEWNNLDDAFIYNNPHHDCPPEWPDFTGCGGGGYEDEGAEESGHGISYNFDYNTPLHMPPRIFIAENSLDENIQT
jgi:hypothetical protein